MTVGAAAASLLTSVQVKATFALLVFGFMLALTGAAVTLLLPDPFVLLAGWKASSSSLNRLTALTFSQLLHLDSEVKLPS